MSISSIGFSGIRASNIALDTTAKNIANSSTPSYKRERVTLNQTPNGVNVSKINQIRDENFAEPNLRKTTSDLYKTKSFSTELEQLNESFSLLDLSKSAKDIIFDSLPSVSDDPTDLNPRQALIDNFKTFASHYNQLDSEIEQQIKDIDNKINQTKQDINQYASSIAKNNNIDHTDVTSIVNKLSELTEIRVEKTSMSTNIYSAKSGYPIVVGKETYPLKEDINQFSGGKLEGLIHAKNEVVEKQQPTFRQNVLDFITTINDQNKAGYDLNGNLGEDIFSFSGRTLKVELSDPNHFAASSEPNEVGNNTNVNNMIDVISIDSFRIQRVDLDNASNIAIANKDILEQIQQSAKDRVETLSGVNLDEEMTNLVKYQQMYQASAKVIETSGILFDTILGLRN